MFQVWNWYPAGCHHHLSILRDLRQGAVRDGQHGCAAVLSVVANKLDKSVTEEGRNDQDL